MVFAIDIGNTNIVIGCFEDKKIIFTERLSTKKTATALEYAISFKNVLELYNVELDKIEGSIISSVVPVSFVIELNAGQVKEKNIQTLNQVIGL